MRHEFRQPAGLDSHLTGAKHFKLINLVHCLTLISLVADSDAEPSGVLPPEPGVGRVFRQRLQEGLPRLLLLPGGEPLGISARLRTRRIPVHLRNAH